MKTTKPPTKVPSKWHVPDGFVLTWYPPFKLRGVTDPNHPILVYSDLEPFVPVDLPDGSVGYNPNVIEATLADFGGEHPGVYALSIAGEHPGFDPDSPLHPSALQIFGKRV